MPAGTPKAHDDGLAIQGEIRKLTILALVLLVLGLLVGAFAVWTLALSVLRGTESPLGMKERVQGLRGAAMLLFIAASGCFARSKGRSAWLALLGLCGCFGALAIAAIPKNCLRCGERGAWNANACMKCGAPMSLRWKPSRPK